MCIWPHYYYYCLMKMLKINTTAKWACVGRSGVGVHKPIEYTLTALTSATELITRSYSNEKSAQCCFNARPTSYATLADIKPTFGECAVLAWKALTLNMLEVNCFQIPMVTQSFVSQHKTHIREIGKLFSHRCRSSI